MGCTLRDITNRLYSKKVECVDDEGQEYFYQAQFKNFKDICETLDIADEIKWIKLSISLSFEVITIAYNVVTVLTIETWDSGVIY